jgi:hypothetical protein
VINDESTVAEDSIFVEFPVFGFDSNNDWSLYHGGFELIRKRGNKFLVLDWSVPCLIVRCAVLIRSYIGILTSKSDSLLLEDIVIGKVLPPSIAALTSIASRAVNEFLLGKGQEISMSDCPCRLKSSNSGKGPAGPT